MQIKTGNLENNKTERQVMDFTEHAGTDGCRHDESVFIEEVDKLRRKVRKLRLLTKWIMSISLRILSAVPNTISS